MRNEERCGKCRELLGWHCSECGSCLVTLLHTPDCSLERAHRRRETHNRSTCTVCAYDYTATYPCLFSGCPFTVVANGALTWSNAEAKHIHVVDDDAAALALASHMEEAHQW